MKSLTHDTLYRTYDNEIVYVFNVFGKWFGKIQDQDGVTEYNERGETNGFLRHDSVKELFTGWIDYPFKGAPEWVKFASRNGWFQHRPSISEGGLYGGTSYGSFVPDVGKHMCNPHSEKWIGSWRESLTERREN